MGYVMVPVPEEHVQEAMRLILRITSRAELRDWDEDSVAELFHAVDEQSRSVLSAVARGSVGGDATPDAQIADAIELTQREVLGVVREINDRAQSESRPPMMVVDQDVEVLPNGRSRPRRTILMGKDLAQHVRDAERAELQAAPHPLLGDGG